MRVRLTARMEAFCASSNSCTRDVFEAHPDSAFALKAVGFHSSIIISKRNMKDVSGGPNNDISAALNALEATIDTSERAMRTRCASAQSIFLLSIFNLLKKADLRARLDN